MTKTPTPASHAVNTAPISADLQGMPRLSEQDAELLEQAATMLEDLDNDQRNRGNCSMAEGARCSADAVRRLAVQLLRAAPASPAQPDAGHAADMQAVGEALMDTIESNYAALKAVGWSGSMNCPSEIVADLIDLIHEAQAQQDAPAAVAVPEGFALVPLARLKNARALVDRGFWVEGSMILDELLAAALAAPAVQSFQQRVQPWMMACFGPEISADRQERNHRFLEEAVELVQANGCTRSEARQLVDYVYDRPAGEPVQEVGGVMVTLAALCLANGLDMHAAGETELARIWTKVEAIRAKQAAKPKHSPLPAAPAAPAAPASQDAQDAQDAARYRWLRGEHERETESLESLCVFGPNDMRECLVPIGSLPGELDAFLDAALAAQQAGGAKP